MPRRRCIQWRLCSEWSVTCHSDMVTPHHERLLPPRYTFWAGWPSAGPSHLDTGCEHTEQPQKTRSEGPGSIRRATCKRSVQGAPSGWTAPLVVGLR